MPTSISGAVAGEGKKDYSGWNQGISGAAFLPGGSRRQSVSLLTQVVGRIQFLLVVGLGLCFLAGHQVWPFPAPRGHRTLRSLACGHFLPSSKPATVGPSPLPRHVPRLFVHCHISLVHSPTFLFLEGLLWLLWSHLGHPGSPPCLKCHSWNSTHALSLAT